MRQVVVTVGAIIILTAAGIGLYSKLTRGEPAPIAPIHEDTGEALVAQEEFDKLAETDPVRLLDQCLTRYQREVNGLHATLQKQERVHGKPRHPQVPQTEVIDLWVHGDVPDPDTQKTCIEVLMKWQSGAKKVLFAEVQGSLFSEKPKSEGGLDGKVLTWRPKAALSAITGPIDANVAAAKDLSRYCIRDAGLYRSMLRTHTAWIARQEAGVLKFEYLGRQKPEQIGRECHVIRRYCKGTEIDSFEIGGTPTGDPATEGFTEVTIYIDVERWLQIGSELYRKEADGTRVLVGAYYFRDVELNPSIPPDTFTIEGLKR